MANNLILLFILLKEKTRVSSSKKTYRFTAQKYKDNANNIKAKISLITMLDIKSKEDLEKYIKRLETKIDEAKEFLKQ